MFSIGHRLLINFELSYYLSLDIGLLTDGTRMSMARNDGRQKLLNLHCSFVRECMGSVEVFVDHLVYLFVRFEIIKSLPSHYAYWQY